MSVYAQRSLAGGEISPSLYGRCDVAKYQSALRTCRNNLVLKMGGTANRPGTQFIGEVKDSSKTVRLIPFVFNASQTYMLEFGNLYFRVIHNGAYVTVNPKSITGITNAAQVVVTSNSHGYSNGEEIIITSVVGMTELNTRNFKISDATTNTYKLKYMDGSTYVDSTSFGAYVSGGTTNKVYTVTTTYAEADLSTLKYVQSADVITIVHPSYPPRTVSRTADDNWAIATITFAPSLSTPVPGTSAQVATGSNINISAISFTGSIVTITTSSAHSLRNGDRFLVQSITGTTQLNGQKFYAKNITSTTLELANKEGSNYSSTGLSAYVSGGTVSLNLETALFEYAVTEVDPVTGEESLPGYTSATLPLPTTTDPILIYTTLSAGPTYNIYKRKSGIYGFIGQLQSDSTTLSDTDIDPDLLTNPPVDPGYFAATNDYPSCTGYFQQRQIFGNTNNDPENVFCSKIGSFHNFLIHRPLQDDDAINFNLAGKQVNAVQDILDLGALIIFTKGGEWSAQGDSAGVLKPSAINSKQYSYHGSGSLSPLVIDSTALFVQARGSIVRDLAFEFQTQGYKGNDLTIFASHLFNPYTLLDWTYQQIPNSIAWMVRSDGTLLGLTYIRDQQIFAWHHHDFDGTVENVSAIPEGNEDFLYLVIKRTVNGQTKRYVERMYTREIDDVIENVFMDCALSYDGRSSTTVTLSGSGWTHDDTLTATAGSASFSSADVGNEIHLTGSDGTIIRAVITAYTSSTVVSVKPNRDVPASMQAVSISDWALAVDQITNLWHLEGKDVSIFADRFVIASPNNDTYSVQTVSNGTITLDKCYGVIHVGLPITADIETLDIDTAQGESIANKKKILTRVNLQVEKTRGVFVGAEAPSDDSIQDLEEIKARDAEFYDDPIDLKNDRIEVNIRPEWNSNGRIFVRQVDPLPMSILSVIPDGLLPFKAGG